ncbi:MAG: DUF1214 domain-containing protein [Anaerolineales bacterium]|nr:DUF1214 domain-containing protein [Anaerolineales bacterium]
MKTKQILILAAAVLMAAGMAWAEESVNLFESPGRKQTAKDFKPAPAKIETTFGELNFLQGAFPTEKSAQKIYDEMDLQRATQAYMDFYPALSLYAIVSSQVRDFGLKTSSDIGVMAYMTPSENYLTGNDVTPYAVASLDLGFDGPMVIEIPPGVFGTANDAAFKFLTGFGVVGPDQGKGGKYLFLTPGYKGDVPDGFFVIKSPSYRIWPMMRGFGEVGTGEQAVRWFKERLKIYPLATGPKKNSAVNAAGMGINSLPPEDGSVFEMLNEIIQHEPTELFNPEQLGRLATLGIEKGKPFKPDARMKKIFDQAAKQGVAMCRAIVYSSRDPEINYWPNRRWEKMFVRNTEFTRNGFSDIDARTLWHYPAIVVAPHLNATKPGVGNSYLTGFRDKNGEFLLGDRTYKLRVPAKVPVKRFWAVTAYDPVSRSLLDSGGLITVSSLRDHKVNSDGSVDVFLGPAKPKGVSEKNWIKTDPQKGFFLVFRFYGPLQDFMDKTWVLNDLELVK